MPSFTSIKQPLLAAVLLAGFICCGWIVWYSWILGFTLFFYDGLLGGAVLLVVAKLKWPRSDWLQLTANTLIVFIVGHAAVDLFWRLRTSQAHARARNAQPNERIYSFEEAKADPLQFKIWWERFVKEWRSVSKEITIPDPDKRLPFKFRPGSSMQFFQSEYVINSLGFRDREFSREKNDAFRIVAIGESTTMGVTLKENGVPWPKLLENMINERLGLRRRVEVINAGVAAYNLRDNLIRLQEDVLPLQPDMILSCHGYNGFQFFDESKWVRQTRPPDYVERPSVFLADIEHRFRLAQYRQRHFRKPLSEEAFAELQNDVLRSTNAKLHRDLIAITQARQIKLAILSYNMAVNQQSPFDVLNFYAAAFPDVRYRIQANRLQTHMLEQLAAKNPDLLYIDTSDGLDGVHDHFIDLMHFTQRGRQIFAENVFRGLEDYLQNHPDLQRHAAAMLDR